MIKKLLYIFWAVTSIMTVSCKKFVEIEPEGYIPSKQTFKTADDAVSAIYGLYGLMQPLVDQIYLAGEVQGDLVVAARGADNFISEIAQNRVTPLNIYTDYTKFYTLILACNNSLKGLAEIAKIDPVNYSSGKYEHDVAEVLYIRAWTYLQLVKIWEDVPYVDNSITTADQIQSIAASKSDVILKKIRDDIDAGAPKMLSLSTNAQSNDLSAVYNDKTKRSQFNPDGARCLAAEVYLYAGDYVKAWETIRFLTPYTYDNLLFHMTEFAGGDSGAPLYGFYDRVLAPINAHLFTSFWAQFIDFDGSKGQKNSLMRWTNNKNGGIYAIKPSSIAIKNLDSTPMILLAYQNTSAGYYIDVTKTGGAAGGNLAPVLNPDGYPVIGTYGDYVRGPGISYQVDGKDTLIFKFLIKQRGIAKNSNDNDANSNDDAMFPLYRDGPTLLMACEILNNVGLSKQALECFNGGYWPGSFMQGSRYRVRAAPLKLDPNSNESLIKQVDKLILEEKALEGGFEGLRWFDLVRVAKRHNDPSILANLVAKKYPVEQRAAKMARLMDRNYWYFPYYQNNVNTNKLLVQKPGY
jgi:starch-binding outer membrane protein, SusD/RagB family